MISSCLMHNKNLRVILNLIILIKLTIRKIFENFQNHLLIKKIMVLMDVVPQYSFRIKNLSVLLINLIKKVIKMNIYFTISKQKNIKMLF